MNPNASFKKIQVNRGLVVLPKSVTPSRISKNLELIELDQDDMDALNDLAGKGGKQRRFVKPDWGSFPPPFFCGLTRERGQGLIVCVFFWDGL